MDTDLTYSECMKYVQQLVDVEYLQPVKERVVYPLRIDWENDSLCPGWPIVSFRDKGIAAVRIFMNYVRKHGFTIPRTPEQDTYLIGPLLLRFAPNLLLSKVDDPDEDYHSELTQVVRSMSTRYKVTL